MLAFLLAIVSIWLWIFSLPLVIVFATIFVPIGSAVLIMLMSIALYIQLQHKDNIIVNSSLRTCVSKLPLETWFTPWTMNTPVERGLICCHPHGILCCGMAIYHLKSSHTVFAVAPVLFYVPVFGWVARLMGLIPATEHMIRKALQEGHAVLLYVGGVEELIAHPHQELYIEKRTGFARIACEAKVSVVPVWVKGEYDTYYTPMLPCLKLRQWLCKYIGVGVMFPWVFGWNGLWLPKRVPLTVCVGKPVQAEQSTELKDLYIRSLHDLR